MTEQEIQNSIDRFEESFQALKVRKDWCHNNCKDLIMAVAGKLHCISKALFVSLLNGDVRDDEFVEMMDKMTNSISNANKMQELVGINLEGHKMNWTGQVGRA